LEGSSKSKRALETHSLKCGGKSKFKLNTLVSIGLGPLSGQVQAEGSFGQDNELSGFTNCENCLIGEMLFYKEKEFALWSKAVSHKALYQM